MDKPLYLFVGQSGSGKTTAAELLEDKFGYKSVQSYTTRPKRHDNETGHIFVSKEEFDKLTDLAAYTEYNGFEYCTTSSQLDDCDIYVIDVPGVETLLKKYTNKDRRICIIYFKSNVSTRIERMVERGDSDMHIVSRLHNDEKYDWFKKLEQLEFYFSELEFRKVKLFFVHADKNKKEVLKEVADIMGAKL